MNRYKVGQNLRVRTQRHAQVYPGLFVYSGAWNAAASNIPLDNARVYTSRDDLLHFLITTKTPQGKEKTYKFCARTQIERSHWIHALGQAKEFFLCVRACVRACCCFYDNHSVSHSRAGLQVGDNTASERVSPAAKIIVRGGGLSMTRWVV